MTDLHRPNDFAVHNERSLKKLAWGIETSVGQFKLFLARCNYVSLRVQLVEQLRKQTSVNIRILELKKQERTLFARIQMEFGEGKPDALMVFDLESVGDLDQLLTATNQVREEFRKHFRFPLVLWVNDEVLEKLLRLAPDFESWATTTEFAIATQELIDFIKKTGEQFLEGSLSFDSLEKCQEIEIACHDLQNRQQVLDLELKAMLESLLGFTESSDLVNRNLDRALKHYRKGLELWQQTDQLYPQAKLLSQIASCYYLKSLQYRELSDESTWQEARQYIRHYFDFFEQAKRLDLVANSILIFGRLLRRLQDWQQLQKLAQKALPLHQAENKPIELSLDYGFLAEVALANKGWIEAKELAQKALEMLATVLSRRSPNRSGVISELLDEVVISYACSFYRFVLSQSQHHLEQAEEALSNLEAAREEGSPEYDPYLYLDILDYLQKLYFEQKQYIKAFEIKLERQSKERQYGFRAFVGASRIQPQRQAKFAPTQVRNPETIAPEITASGRQLDVERLIERIGRNDCKLIVIHGESGVGKSSLVHGGLMPALKQKAIGISNILAVPMRVYTSWVEQLGKLLAGVLKEKGIHLPVPLNSEAAILEQLQQGESRNLRTVLIFDQFEEFFFIYPDLGKRRQFFEFLGACLNILSVKVILSLRKDYLHYLLECNRLRSMKIIGNDILTKNVLYELGNFSPAYAKAIIQHLTDVSNFHLEPALIEQLVQDLAGNLGEVRPIELQVVGAQLQTENVTTLTEYQKCGRKAKEELVKRYLAEVVEDCGTENKQAAELMLYLLTDEKGTRPLKTRAELERDLQVLSRIDLSAEASKLDVVLKIFVDSGLVVLLPEIPDNRYQLVHDYLASFIRQQQEPKLNELIAELEREREQRKFTEEELKRVEQVNQVLAETQQKVELALEAEKKAKENAEQILADAQRKAKQRVHAGAAILGISLVLGPIGFYVVLPQMSSFFQEIALEKHYRGNYQSSQIYLERAINLNPNNYEAYYNLGVVYEEIHNNDLAINHYEIAAYSGDFPEAYNNLGRLYILEEEYAIAVSVLYKGLLRYNDIGKVEQNRGLIQGNTSLKYALIKNLGWARLEQKRYDDAMELLSKAIDLDDTNASAHCLLAQVLEQTGNQKQALIEWETCFKLTDVLTPEEDKWKSMAQQRISARRDRNQDSRAVSF